MNAAELEKMRIERKHKQPTPICAADLCWCGNCHCQRCQEVRQITGSAAPGDAPQQCSEPLMVPMYNRSNPCVSVAVCTLDKGHPGKHKTSEACGNKEWQ